MQSLMGILSVMALVAVQWGCGDSAASPLGGDRDDPECAPSAKVLGGDEGGGGGEHSGGEGGEGGGEGGGEHSGEGGEGREGGGGGEGGEESASQYGRTDTFDEIRAGARLVIAYDEAAGEFRGSVENTTGSTLTKVRVEIHLSNGLELGPTTPVDLGPGQVHDVVLMVPESARDFTTFGAHPEVGGQGTDVSTGIRFDPEADCE